VSTTGPSHPAALDSAAPAPRWGILGFTALVAITPAMPHFSLPHLPLSVDDLTVMAAAVLGLVAVLRTGLWRDLRWRRAPEAYALAAMIPFTLIAAVHAGSIRSLAAGPARWALNAVLVALAYLLLRGPTDGRRMIKALVGVSAFEAAFGLVAYLFRWSGFGGYIGTSYTLGHIGGWTIYGRITGTTGMASTFIAGFFALTLPAAAGLAMAARGRARWLWVGTAVLIFLGLAFTLSRTPIALGTAAVVVLLLAATRPRIWIPIVTVLAVVFIATPLRARMLNFDNDRLALWNAGWRMFRDHWFFGVGPDRYIEFLPLYQNTPWGKATATPHNSLLYVGAESGVLAAIALGIAIACSLRFLRRRDPLILGPMVGLAAFVVDAMTTNLYEIPSIAIAAWMIAPAVAPLIARTVRAGGPPIPDTAPSPGTAGPGQPAPGGA
jgi:O-antigen ligase